MLTVQFKHITLIRAHKNAIQYKRVINGIGIQNLSAEIKIESKFFFRFQIVFDCAFDPLKIVYFQFGVCQFNLRKIVFKAKPKDQEKCHPHYENWPLC